MIESDFVNNKDTDKIHLKENCQPIAYFKNEITQITGIFKYNLEDRDGNTDYLKMKKKIQQ
jgi:hypothetical protein